MKGYKITDTNFSQEVNLPAGTYTYSCRVMPVGTSYTFKIDSNLFTFEDLVPGVLSARIKYTFELAEPGVVFYPSNTLGDSIFEPQIEEGVFATTPGAHALDFERLISEAGIEIDHEALSLYAKKADVSAEIKIQADQINSTVGGLSNDVDELRGSVTSIEQTTTSISATVSNHTSQIAGFQITVDQIYAAIEDAGSGEFSSILQRLDLIELRVGDISGNLSTLTQTVDGFEARVQTAEGNLSTLTQTVDGFEARVQTAEGAIGQLQISATEIEGRVTNAEGKISTFQQTATSIAARVETTEGILSQITLENGRIQIIAKDYIKLEGYTTINDNFQVLEDGSIVANNGEFKGGLKQPFVDVSESTVENFWNTNKTSWACNFFEESPFASLIIRVIPCRPVLNGQIFRFHARRKGIILQPEVSYKFYENGTSLNEIVLDVGDAIEMISVSIDNVFKSWDIIRRYKCRKYNE